MLQQTQVATVVPYFERFLDRFPTLTHLADADEHEVLKLWEGLGYYRRARELHKAARQLVAEHNGRFPTDPKTLSELPGMGRYTVGAVLSQAFDQRLPILEANSRRVLCRIFDVRGDPLRGPVQRRLWQLAEQLLPRRGAGEFNQAIMELGAVICTPKAPRCDACPLAKDCSARRLDLQEAIPSQAKAAEVIAIREAAVVIFRGSRVLIVQRPAEGRWARLWEFPHAQQKPGESVRTAAKRLIRALTGLQARLEGELLTVRHSVTRYRIELSCFTARHQGGSFASKFYCQGRWLPPAKLTDFPMSAPQRRIARAILSNGRA